VRKKANLADLERTRTVTIKFSEDADKFSQLPTPIITHIFSWLNGVDVAHAEGVSKRWNVIASKKNLWKDVCLNVWNDDPKKFQNPKGFYKLKFEEDKKKQEEVLMEQKRAAERDLYSGFKWLLSVFGSFYWNFFFYFPLFAFAILLPYKLDNDDSMSWYSVFAPLYVFDGLCMLSCISLVVWKMKWDYLYDDLKEGGFFRFISSVGKDTHMWIFMICGAVVSMTIFTILAPIKAEDPQNSMKWGSIIIPLLITFYVACVAARGAWTEFELDDEDDYWTKSLLFIGALMMVAMPLTGLLGAINADEILDTGTEKYSWAAAFIPMWISNAVFVILPILMMCFSCCDLFNHDLEGTSCLGYTCLNFFLGVTILCVRDSLVFKTWWRH